MGKFQLPISIRTAITKIKRQELAIPAIQRDYVWEADQVTWLFDSLMRGYPISSFLFWNVRGKNVIGYKFYDFLREYREDFRIRGNERRVSSDDQFSAVLDGQQRLTSLYIGFCGSYAWRVSYGRNEDDNERSRPTRRLYLNVSKKINESDEEDGHIYDFQFKKDSETNQKDIFTDEVGEKWIRVGKVLDFPTSIAALKYFMSLQLGEVADEIIERLLEVVDEAIINFYQEDEDDLHKALNIFIRINRGGIKLSFSAIIMSIAISYWKRDAKLAFDKLISSVWSEGFSINNDFILKVFLFLYSKDIRFKATNFTSETATLLEKNWDDISECIKETFRLLSTFGYSEQCLPSKNAIIPIIYYLYHKKIWLDYSQRTAFREDRRIICAWLHKVNLFRVFGSSADSKLIKVRKAFTDDISNPITVAESGFPIHSIKKNLDIELSVSDEIVDSFIHTQKDNQYAFPILALLFPHLDYKNYDFHKDHMHPKKAFENLDWDKIPDTQKEYYTPFWWNSIVNLQMLDKNENESKNAGALKEWVDFETTQNGKDRATLLQRIYIPQTQSLDFESFPEFARNRAELLHKKLKSILQEI